MDEKKTLIDCRDVALGYEGKALSRHLSFQVRSGDYLCIVGENGTGKSTLLKVLLGLMKPLDGAVTADKSLRAGAIGYLPQQTRAQRDFPATVYEVVLSGFLSARRGRFLYTAAEKSQALMNMGKLGVLELKDHCYRELSGGQQQRGPRGRPRHVPHPGVPEPQRGHRHRHGDPRPAERPEIRHPHPPRGAQGLVVQHGGGLRRLALW